MSARIDHVNITVANLDESVAWYSKIFGFKKVEGGRTAFGKKWAIVALNDSMIAMSERKNLKAADQDDESAHKIYHFGLRIDDAEAWRAKINECGLRVYYGGEVEYPHSRSWYVHDPSGHEIEVSWTGAESMRFPELAT